MGGGAITVLKTLTLFQNKIYDFPDHLEQPFITLIQLLSLFIVLFLNLF